MNSNQDETEPVEASWFERGVNVQNLIVGLTVICAALVFADLFYTNPHPHFAIETTFAFQAWFGFVTFVIIVFLGRLLRKFVSRSEDYYDVDR